MNVLEMTKLWCVLPVCDTLLHRYVTANSASTLLTLVQGVRHSFQTSVTRTCNATAQAHLNMDYGEIREPTRLGITTSRVSLIRDMKAPEMTKLC